MRRPTIDDVARLAGVSKVTVSYVLNGRTRDQRISDQTAERVLLAVRELNYRPNGNARALATNRAETIAVVFQYGDLFSALSAFTSEVMRGVCASVVRHHFDLMLHTKPVENPQREADNLTDGRVDGALVLRDPDDPALCELLRRGFPVVQFFTRNSDPQATWVDCDNLAGGRMATQHLLDLGHRRIACLHGPVGSASSTDRLRGYAESLRLAGLDADPELRIPAESPTSSFERLIHLMKGPDRPTAVFVWSDDVAISVLDVLRSLDLRVPEDVSVVGFDSLEVCNRTSPPLTSVNQPVSQMADEAVSMLIAMINGEPRPRRQVLYAPVLDVRASTMMPIRTRPL